MDASRRLWYEEFYRAAKQHTGASHITELVNDQGVSCHDRADLKAICNDYYKSLYTKGTQTDEVTSARSGVLECLADRLSPEMKASLDQPITRGELSAALTDMTANKAPGKDGLTAEFFKKFWPLISEDYTNMITDAIVADRFPNGVTCGVLTLLHKGGNRNLLTNWRPIALLNVSYKIYAKALQLRLQPVLSEIIGDDQSAFLHGRFILDNIMLTHETIDWARHSQHDLIFLKLDFRKAYDRVDWTFLFDAMAKLGFPDGFVQMVKLLFKEASNHVNVNGRLSPAFPINRGVCQGCPVAPYLFLIVAEALNALVKKQVAANLVKRITLPFNEQHVLL